MKRSLDQMVVVITGASAGIGLALARGLSHRGARLALAARREDRLKSLNEELGGAHLCVVADVSVRADCERLIASTIERFGRIDTLVCNAGYGFHASVAQATPEQYQAIFQTNVFGTTDCIRQAVPVMRGQEPHAGWRGQIMIVSSALARRSIPFFGPYSATKAAQLSIAESLRVELRSDEIAVTSVHPVGTATEFGDRSAERSNGRRPKKIKGEATQTAEQVADAMIRAIESPRPEVWPHKASRLTLSLATLMPRFADRVLDKRKQSIQGDQP